MNDRCNGRDFLQSTIFNLTSHIHICMFVNVHLSSHFYLHIGTFIHAYIQYVHTYVYLHVVTNVGVFTLATYGCISIVADFNVQYNTYTHTYTCANKLVESRAYICGLHDK